MYISVPSVRVLYSYAQQIDIGLVRPILYEYIRGPFQLSHKFCKLQVDHSSPTFFKYKIYLAFLWLDYTAHIPPFPRHNEVICMLICIYYSCHMRRSAMNLTCRQAKTFCA